MLKADFITLCECYLLLTEASSGGKNLTHPAYFAVQCTVITLEDVLELWLTPWELQTQSTLSKSSGHTFQAFSRTSCYVMIQTHALL